VSGARPGAGTLLVDIGNTRVKWARLVGETVGPQRAAAYAGWTSEDFARTLFGARRAFSDERRGGRWNGEQNPGVRLKKAALPVRWRVFVPMLRGSARDDHRDAGGHKDVRDIRCDDTSRPFE